MFVEKLLNFHVGIKRKLWGKLAQSSVLRNSRCFSTACIDFEPCSCGVDAADSSKCIRPPRALSSCRSSGSATCDRTWVGPTASAGRAGAGGPLTCCCCSWTGSSCCWDPDGWIDVGSCWAFGDDSSAAAAWSRSADGFGCRSAAVGSLADKSCWAWLCISTSLGSTRKKRRFRVIDNVIIEFIISRCSHDCCEGNREKQNGNKKRKALYSDFFERKRRKKKMVLLVCGSEAERKRKKKRLKEGERENETRTLVFRYGGEWLWMDSLSVWSAEGKRVNNFFSSRFINNIKHS